MAAERSAAADRAATARAGDAAAVVRLEGVSKTYGSVVGLAGIDLAIAPGEFLSLLGPSGCGKTTTLRLVAGFEMPTAGRILIDDAEVTTAPPYERPVNTVFQDYALFPHMSVSENVGFGLSVARVPTAALRRRVADALALVGLSDKAEGRVGQLSGGQRQRVALARALVCEPRVLLLDEPLAALDAHLREQMQVELKKLQARLGTTFVMVTHDQTEALSISDRIVVMNRGRIEQIASPAGLYDAPATRFVASFIGAMNLLDGRVLAAEGTRVTVEASGLRIGAETADPAALAAGRPATVAVRPEDLVIAAGEGEPAPGSVRGQVAGVAFHGRSLRVHVALPDGALVLVDVPRQGAPLAVAPGDAVTVAAPVATGRAFAAA